MINDKFRSERFQYKLMNTRTLVKPTIICLLFAEIIMVGVTLIKIGYTIRIYIQDERNPLSGFGRISPDRKNFLDHCVEISTYKKMNVNFERIFFG